jgi:Divergent InlB B-repeat domain
VSLGERHLKRCCMVVLCLAAALVVSIGAASAPRASGADSQVTAAESAKKCKGKKHGHGRKRGKGTKKCRKVASRPNVALQPNIAAQTPKVTLTVGSTLPGAGAIDSSPTGISCGIVCTERFDPGTVVRLSATQAPGYFHTAWYGGGCSGRGDCVVVLDSDTAVVAGFVRRVTVTADAGTGGSVEATAPGAPFGVCTAGGCEVNPGDEVTLTASPDSGFMFDQWTGDCSGKDPVFTFSAIVSPDKVCHASFVPLPDMQLTVNLPGTGLGNVTSSPAGINCPVNCSASFQEGTVVTLTAAPADGSIFASWFGPCSGLEPCTFTLNAPTTVTADFVLVNDPTDP